MSHPQIAPRFEPALSNLPLWHQGKTRDTFELPDGNLLVVATDRISTHDIVHESEIPYKGEVLTTLTVHWFRQLQQFGIPHHLVAQGSDIYAHLPEWPEDYPQKLQYRAIVVKKLEMIPAEFVLRAYLSEKSSIWKKFYSKGELNPYGIELPLGLPIMYEFLPPIFTPTDKSETDDPLNSAEVAARYPDATRLGHTVFTLGRHLMRNAGLEAIDTKFEFGYDANGELCLGDEVLTPDSSRFCALSEMRPGVEPPHLDKQPARDAAMEIWGDNAKVPIKFSPKTVQEMSDIYLDICHRITNEPIGAFQSMHLN